MEWGLRTATSSTFTVSANVIDLYGLADDRGNGTGNSDDLASAFAGPAIELDGLDFFHVGHQRMRGC